MPLSHHIRPDPYCAPSDEKIALARAMYPQGFTVSRILAATGMALGTLYFWLDGGPLDENGQPRLPQIPRRRKTVLGKRRRPIRTDHVSLASRLFCTAERQVRDIEARLARPGGGAERARDVRMMSVLVRTLRDLSAFNAGAGLQKPPEAHDDPVPADPDELRRQLALRIERFVASRSEARQQDGGGMPQRPETE
jgi:hypothetical protein